MASSNGQTESADTTGTGIETVEVKDGAPAGNSDNPGKVAAFTPGPWHPVSGQGAHHNDVYIRAGERHADGSWPAVAKCCSSGIGGRVAVQANSQLIAAAPDLYEACKALVDARLIADVDSAPTTSEPEAIRVSRLVRAALAKAEGRTP